MASPVQIIWGNNGTVAAATVSAAFAVNTTPGNAIVVFAISNRASGDNLTIGDTQVNTYTTSVTLNEANTPATMRSWVAANTAGGANTVTVTNATANAVMGIIICEIAGTSTNSGDDAHKALSQVAPGTTVGSLSTGAIATTGSLVFGLGVACWVTGGASGVNSIAARRFTSPGTFFTGTSANSTNITATGWGNGSGSGIGPARIQWATDIQPAANWTSAQTDATNGGTGGAVFDSMAVYLDEIDTLIGQACL